MKLGITGTRDGMCRDQQKNVAFILANYPISEFHHGDCIGVDDEAATIAAARAIQIICHPPVDELLRANNPYFHERRTAKKHFARNRDIVDETDVLLVVPRQNEHQKFGGTWYTHDYAKKKGKRIVIVWPDGTVEGTVVG